MGADKKSSAGSSTSIIKEIILVAVFVIILVLAVIIGIGALGGNKNKTEGIVTEEQIVTRLSEKENAKLNKYIEKYEDKTMGYVAYSLNRIRIYSIPLCVLLFIVGAFLRFIVGQEKYIENERGYGMIVGAIIFFAIAQIAPLVFALIVTFGRS